MTQLVSRRSLSVYAGLIALGAPLTAAAQATDSAEVTGVVTSPTRMTIADAEITVLGQTAKTTSDAVGKFRLRGVLPGVAVVRVRRIGFNAEYFRATLQPGESKYAEIVMSPGAYELPEVNVNVRNIKPIEYAWTTRYDDFFRRKAVGLGVYRDRKYIEQTGPFRTANLLTGIAGVHLRFRHSGPSGTDIYFSRCDKVSVWIDGNKQRYADTPGGLGRENVATGMVAHATSRDKSLTYTFALSEYLDRVSPMQIEMMEIYRGPGEMPAEFIDDSCAAVVIWTR